MAVTPADRAVCLLTGAGGTLGRAFCRRFSGRYAIAAVCRARGVDGPTQHTRFVDPLDPEAASTDDAVFEIRSDLRRPGEVSRVVELALARFGRVDLLVNAAGRAAWGRIISSATPLATADEQFQVNSLLPLRLSAELVEQYWRDRAAENRQRNRSIVNVSSIAGLYVVPDRGQGVYGASKAALNMLTCHLADEFAQVGIRVNALAPDAFPEVVSTESAADAVVELATGDLTGKILTLDRHGRQIV